MCTSCSVNESFSAFFSEFKLSLDSSTQLENHTYVFVYNTTYVKTYTHILLHRRARKHTFITDLPIHFPVVLS